RCHSCDHRKAFKSLVKGWFHPIKKTKKGESTSVRKFRLIDKLIGSQSPMNFVRPAVGSMYFEASKLIKSSPASILPVRTVKGENRFVIEAYPKLVVDRVVGKPYKEEKTVEDGFDAVRKSILDDIRSNLAESKTGEWYGLFVEMDEDDANRCIAD